MFEDLFFLPTIGTLNKSLASVPSTVAANLKYFEIGGIGLVKSAVAFQNFANPAA